MVAGTILLAPLLPSISSFPSNLLAIPLSLSLLNLLAKEEPLPFLCTKKHAYGTRVIVVLSVELVNRGSLNTVTTAGGANNKSIYPVREERKDGGRNRNWCSNRKTRSACSRRWIRCGGAKQGRRRRGRMENERARRTSVCGGGRERLAHGGFKHVERERAANK